MHCPDEFVRLEWQFGLPMAIYIIFAAFVMHKLENTEKFAFGQFVSGGSDQRILLINKLLVFIQMATGQ